MEFDVKMEHFRCNSRTVAEGHTPEALATITFACIVSKKTVIIALMIATLNDLGVRFSDILNACVQTPFTDKVLTTFGPEFGKNARKTTATVRAS